MFYFDFSFREIIMKIKSSLMSSGFSPVTLEDFHETVSFNLNVVYWFHDIPVGYNAGKSEPKFH